VSVMHEGRLIAEGSFEEIASHPAVVEAYLGR
jgi:ABC-type branched-subunit amino acid transport system ATPase component